jgi:uncharacterized protein involved in exopolysaccharide biosynthesis
MSIPIAPEPSPSRNGLLRELELLSRYRRAFLAVVLVITVGAIVYSLLAKKIYEAHGSVLATAAERGGIFGGISAILQDLPIQGANLPGVTTSADLLAAMLHSRRLQIPIIEEFDLVTRYKAETVDHAILTLNGMITTTVSDEGILHIRFRDEDPEFAAEVCARLIEMLDAYNIEVSTAQARLQREFIEARVEDANQELAQAEEAFGAYQSEHALVIPPDDMSALGSSAELLARKLLLEVELEALRQFIDPQSTPYRQRATELEALETRLREIPGVGVDVVRLYRDAKVQSELSLFLRWQLETARLDEQRALPTLRVLDEPRPPVLRSWPQRKLIVIVAFLMAGALGVLMAHTLDFIERERDTIRRVLRGPGG